MKTEHTSRYPGYINAAVMTNKFGCIGWCRFTQSHSPMRFHTLNPIGRYLI